MSIQNTYYMPLKENLFESALFSEIVPKKDGRGSDALQKHDKDGVPIWSIFAFVSLPGESPDKEMFSLAAPQKVAEEIANLKVYTPIKFIGLTGGKWSKEGTDKTTWTFKCDAIMKVSA